MATATQSVEDYIKGIYKLESDGGKVTTSALARHLGIGDGSVTGMVKKLSQKRLIRYEPYQGVHLTEAGRKIAMRTVRRHRLWEMFLVKFLNYSWDEIHNEAERLEHTMSDELERRLDKALGFPKFDPHGDPIPNERGELPLPREQKLAEVEAKQVVTIVRVSDENPEILQYLTRLGLGLQSRMKIIEKVSFDKSVIVKVGSKEVVLSSQLAQSISVA
jgi:DtxR family Mn-dependent transcriptional regulator